MSSLLDRIADFVSGPIAGGITHLYSIFKSRSWSWCTSLRAYIRTWFLRTFKFTSLRLFHSYTSSPEKEIGCSFWYDMGCYWTFTSL